MIYREESHLQLGLSAPHRCVTIIARKMAVPVNQTSFLDTSGLRVTVDLAICSRTMKYRPAKGVPVPPGHLIHKAFASGEGDVLRAPADIPFRKGTNWIVESEAMRLGSQVFALFHVGPPPAQNAGQLGLDLSSDRAAGSADR
jgi:hypothetical protein